jgi:hypothetical protein
MSTKVEKERVVQILGMIDYLLCLTETAAAEVAQKVHSVCWVTVIYKNNWLIVPGVESSWSSYGKISITAPLIPNTQSQVYRAPGNFTNSATHDSPRNICHQDSRIRGMLANSFIFLLLISRRVALRWRGCPHRCSLADQSGYSRDLRNSVSARTKGEAGTSSSHRCRTDG